ncbi:MAG: translation initiation factor IF-2 [Corallococcus sp.]|nr:translation initiation factor IF-2 [Corallococcus sp.]
MANNSNIQNRLSVDNIKALVGANADRTQSVLQKLRQQIRALNDEISVKEKEFILLKSTADTNTQIEQDKVGEQVTLTTDEMPEKTEKSEALDNTVKSQAEPKPASKPEAKENVPTVSNVVTKVENGIEVKTYTDGNGSVRVRKFLDTSAPKRPVSSSRVQNNDGRRNFGKSEARPQNEQKRTGTQTTGGNKKQQSSAAFTPVISAPKGEQKSFGNKNKTHEKSDERRGLSKKSLLTRNFSNADYDEDKVVRRARSKKSSETKAPVQTQKITNAVVTTQEVSIKVLSEKIGVSVSEIIKQLFKENIFKTINDSIDFDYAAYVAGLYDVTLELKPEKSAEDIITESFEDDGLANNKKRPPIVTVMGHVDHGKTSLLDAIRNTRVTSGEAGGITQHIGAYTVEINGESITFIDTPGHAAFTAMRARGAKITDVAIIVVAADDGVMPQTVEAINHAKAAGVSIIVAINKMDKPDINVERVKQQLAEYELLAEDWGGDTIMIPVSAKTNMGIKDLLESVLLVTELKELKANPEKRAIGTVIEAKLDKGRGPVATVLVSNGTLNIGDSVIAGFATGKIRAMFDDKGKKVKSAGPSTPVEVLGFSDVPQAGDFMHVADEKLVRKAAEERKNKIKVESAKQTPSMNLGDLFGKISEGQLKTLNLIIKTDVQGSLEALKSSMEKISNEEVRVCPIHGGVGAINETDVMLARASEAIIIGFNVRADSNAKVIAEKEGVDIRLYNVIYDAVDDVTAAMKGLLAPKFKETVLGSVEVREVFKITGVGSVAGAYVTSGKAVRNAKVRVYRNDVSVYDGNILALKRFKDDVKEVAAGYECGISVENYNDLKIGDVFEIYQMEEIER